MISKTDLYQIGIDFKEELTELFELATDRYQSLEELKRNCETWYEKMLEEK